MEKGQDKDSGTDIERNGKYRLRQSRDRLARGGAARRSSRKASQEFSKSMLTRSWHSIDFKPRKSKSRESLRSRTSVKNVPSETRLTRL